MPHLFNQLHRAFKILAASWMLLDAGVICSGIENMPLLKQRSWIIPHHLQRIVQVVLQVVDLYQARRWRHGAAVFSMQLQGFSENVFLLNQAVDGLVAHREVFKHIHQPFDLEDIVVN
jgi:hypothetical protein